jgi:hypothetical protein
MQYLKTETDPLHFMTKSGNEFFSKYFNIIKKHQIRKFVHWIEIIRFIKGLVLYVETLGTNTIARLCS